MLVDQILSAPSLFALLEQLDEFCMQSYMRNNDEVCLELKNRLARAEDNDLLVMLSSYLVFCEDAEEIIGALYEFISICQGFIEADEQASRQLTKAEVEAVLDECEEKCSLKSCIEKEHTLNMAEVMGCNRYREFTVRRKGSCINLLLPRIGLDIDIKQYIAEDLGSIFYEILQTKLDPEMIAYEMKRYIPETRRMADPTRQLFRRYFYDVICYQSRKSGVYKEFDEHIRRVIVVEFFKRMAGLYLQE